MLARTNLAHPSIVAPFDAGVEGTVAYLAEDYVAADSLDAAIRQYGPAPASQAIRILAAAGGAIDFAAAVGVHHGALHPRDVLVTPDDTRITGLGVGRALEAVGLRGPMRRPYVAPERVQREGWDARADVYSLGVLARELLAGRSKPDAGAEPLPDDQAERLKPVLARATAARPADRFSTCLELIGAVQDALAGAAARPATKPESPVAREARAKQPTHDLLLPLDGEETDDATVLGAGVRLRLDEAEAVADFTGRADRGPVAAAAAMPLPDLDLHARANGGEPPADTFDLSDLDSQLAAEPGSFERESPAHELPVEHAREDGIPEPAPFEGADSFSIAGPRTAELGPPIEMPVAGREADEAERFTGAFAVPPEATPEEPPSVREPESSEIREPVPSETTVALLDAPVAAEMPRPHLATPARSSVTYRLYTAVLIVGIVLGAVAGYFVGSWRATARLSSAATATSAQSTQAPAPSAQPAATSPSTGPAAAALIPGAGAAQPQAPAGTAPAARTAAPVVKGTLVVRSTPRGASVAINGRARGRTPLRLTNLPAGRYTVRVARSGYTTEERTVVLSADQPTSTLALTLARPSRAQPASRAGFFGTLSVESLPSGAGVFVDGRLLGTTPLADARVAAGSHVLRVDRTGFRPWTEAIQIVTGQSKRVTASLNREPK